MIHFIESYQPDDSTITIQGRTFPATCLVEDDQGVRFLIGSGLSVSAHYWTQAHAGGARIFVIPLPGGWAAMTIEEFAQRRTENHNARTYEIEPEYLTFFPEFPSLREVIEAGEAEAAAPKRGFVHLHAHSEFSALDGMSRVEEMVDAVVADNQPALAVTDHGACAAHPVLQSQAEDKGIKPIFGIEANLVDDRLIRDKEKLYEYWHLIMWAGSQEGLVNLWAMSTEAHRTGFYGRPRMDWDTLERHSSGVLASTGCLRGPVARALEQGDDIAARANLARLLGIFGDRLYVELQTNKLQQQRVVNEALVELAREYSLPVIAAVDSHYPTEDHKQAHDIWIKSQTNKDLKSDTEIFSDDSDYHLMTEAEVRQALSYLPQSVVDEAVANTQLVADRAGGRVEGDTSAPVFSKAPTKEEAIEKDVRRLIEVCTANWHRCQGQKIPEEEYLDRFEREMELLVDKGFCGYFLLVSDYCRWAREHGILVGPGRGSGSGSLVAYLSDITGIDPLAADLMFERFLTKGRKALPDFDVDFPASKRAELTQYIVDRYGEENVVRVGTHIRLKNKGVVRDMFRVFRDSLENFHYPDLDAISGIIDEAEADKTGLGMPWEDLWDEEAERLQPYRDKYPELFAACDKLEGRLKTYGKHAAGLVIAPDASLTENLPLRLAGNDIVAEFDMEELEKLGLVKFDILTLRTLDTIQQTVDMIREQKGDVIDVYSWDKEYEDPLVWEEISAGHTLGIFQVETAAGTRECKRFQPTDMDGLADIITLVRPGPMRSGLTETYFRRKLGEEPVTYLDERLEPILSKTYGAMIYQEQVMKTCMVLAGYDETEADGIRKILGKKKIELVEEAGKEFRERAVQHGTDPEVARIIWDQMAEFARYGFNRSHAYGYAMLGYWTAWLKFHYPVQFLTAVMSTVDKGRIPEFITEARRMGYKVLPPDINLSGKGFSAGETEIRYGFDGVMGIGAAAVDALMEGQPYVSFEDFMERKGRKANMGVVKTMARVGAFDSLVPNRRALVERLEWETGAQSTTCIYKDEEAQGAPNDLPCTFDWANEPIQIGKRGQEVKQKPPPKRCTIRCRNYTPPQAPDFDTLPEYTQDEVMAIEMELLGIHLTYTPFDRVPDWIWDADKCMEEFGFRVMKGSEVADLAIPEGSDSVGALTVAVLQKWRPHTTKTGKPMAFGVFQCVDAELDVTIFPEAWESFKTIMNQGDLYLAHLKKNVRGYSLAFLTPM